LPNLAPAEKVNLAWFAGLVANSQFPATFATTSSQNCPAIPIGHPRHKTMLAAARDALGLPGSFSHCSLSPPVHFLKNLDL